MKGIIKINVLEAHKDYKLLKQFSELISDFDRLKSAILFSEVLSEVDYDISDDIREYWKNRDKECTEQCAKKEDEESSDKKVEIKEVNDFESFRQMLKDLLI